MKVTWRHEGTVEFWLYNDAGGKKAANAYEVALIGEIERLRAALEKIASCESHYPNDVVAVARDALKK